MLKIQSTFFRLSAKLNPREIFQQGLNREIKSTRNFILSRQLKTNIKA